MPTPDTGAPVETTIGWKPVIKAGILATLIIVSLVTIYLTPLRDYLRLDSEARWREIIDGLGAWGPLAFILGGAIIIGIGVPRTPYCFLGGALFGWFEGFIWSHIGAVLGSVGCAMVARYLGQEWMAHKFGRRYARLEKRIQENSFIILLLLRVCPVAPNPLTNYLFGISTVSWRPFVLATFIGQAPIGILMAMVGDGAASGNHLKTIISLALFVLVTLAFVIYYRQSSVAASVAADLAGANGATDEAPPIQP